MLKKSSVLFIILIIFSCEDNIILENKEFLTLTFSIANKEIVPENSGIIITFSDSLNILSLEADSIYESLMVYDEIVELEVKKIELSKKFLFNDEEQTIWYDERNKTVAIIKETEVCYQDGIDSIFQLKNSNRLHIESGIMDIYDRYLFKDLNLNFFLDTTNVGTSPNVFPNPYFGSSTIEASRGDKIIVFSHLPDTCAIVIYNSQGEFINSLLHTSQFNDSMERWDVKSYLGEYVNPGIYRYEIHNSTEIFLHGVLIIASQVNSL